MDVFEQAYNNSFLLITNKISYKQMLKARKKEVVFAHDPEVDITMEDLQRILKYYEEQEWYERCQEIKNVIDSI